MERTEAFQSLVRKGKEPVMSSVMGRCGDYIGARYAYPLNVIKFFDRRSEVYQRSGGHVSRCEFDIHDVIQATPPSPYPLRPHIQITAVPFFLLVCVSSVFFLYCMTTVK